MTDEHFKLIGAFLLGFLITLCFCYAMYDENGAMANYCTFNLDNMEEKLEECIEENQGVNDANEKTLV